MLLTICLDTSIIDLKYMEFRYWVFVSVLDSFILKRDLRSNDNGLSFEISFYENIENCS